MIFCHYGNQIREDKEAFLFENQPRSRTGDRSRGNGIGKREEGTLAGARRGFLGFEGRGKETAVGRRREEAEEAEAEAAAA